METKAKRPLIAIYGPTASGKSALALKLALDVGGEIVSADSRQVYRFMDIGTDKASPEERALVAHHMVDVVDPDEPFTLAMYQDGAYRAIEAIQAAGNVPILAGGTPLYVNAVLEGWQIPRVEPDMELRRHLEDEALRMGSAVLHTRLAEIDPAAGAKILPTNTRRIIRALEVALTTGQPISAQQSRTTPPYDILEIGLRSERPELYRRIDTRVDRYMDRGLVDEVRGLHDMGYGFDLPAMSGIGYRQIGEYLLGRATLDEAVQRIKWDTHAFTRHQGNWFRRKLNAHWLDVTSLDPTQDALALARDFLSGGR